MGESGGLTAVESPEAAVVVEVVVFTELVDRASIDVASRGRTLLAGLIVDDGEGFIFVASWSSEGIGSRLDGVAAAEDCGLVILSFATSACRLLTRQHARVRIYLPRVVIGGADM